VRQHNESTAALQETLPSAGRILFSLDYAMLGRTCVLLLCGGDKRRQASDIKRAIEYLEDFKQRTGSK
jgi:hypothetical protein